MNDEQYEKMRAEIEHRFDAQIDHLQRQKAEALERLQALHDALAGVPPVPVADETPAKRMDVQGALVEMIDSDCAPPYEAFSVDEVLPLMPPGTNKNSVASALQRMAAAGNRIELVTKGAGKRPSTFRLLAEKPDDRQQPLPTGSPSNGDTTQQSVGALPEGERPTTPPGAQGDADDVPLRKLSG